MISQKSAEQCTLHFSGLLNFPKARQARAELDRMFAQYAVHERHANAVIRRWIDENKLCPTPAELREALLTLSVKSECPDCNDMGWVLHPSRVGFTRCHCTQNSEPDCLALGSRTIPQAERIRDPDTHRVTGLRYAPPLTGIRGDDSPEHPEVALGLPRICATGKTLAVRQREARLLGYDGPLTLAQFVAAGKLTRAQADEHIRAWEEFHHEKFRVIEEPRLERKPAQSEIENAMSQTP